MSEIKLKLNYSDLKFKFNKIKFTQNLNGGNFCESQDKLIKKCNICQDKFVKYTCPSCNLRYCSLDCFKSPDHLNCSESFYRNQIIQDTKIEGSLNSNNQKQILEILKRFELDQENLDAQEEDQHDFFGNITKEQLDNLSEEDLLKFLSPDQVLDFHQKFHNGHLDQHFIEATINSQFNDPWWIDQHSIKSHSTFYPPCISQSILPQLPSQPNPSLAYHTFSLMLGYVFLLRHFGLGSLQEASQDKSEIIKYLPNFLPILFDSSLRPISILECLSIFLSTTPSATPDVIPLLIKDLGILFSAIAQSKILMISNESSVKRLYESALADLHEFLSTHFEDLKLKKRNKATLLKLRYLIAFAMVPSRVETLIKDLTKVALNPDFDNLQQTPLPDSENIIQRLLQTPPSDNNKPKIVEL